MFKKYQCTQANNLDHILSVTHLQLIFNSQVWSVAKYLQELNISKSYKCLKVH